MDDRAKKDFWIKMVADYELSGQTQREFSEKRGISIYQLRYWVYSLRSEARPLTTKAEREAAVITAKSKEALKRTHFLPVEVVASPALSARAATTVPAILEVAFPGGASLRFPVGTDTDYVKKLISAM